jgi:hypothetical protein
MAEAVAAPPAAAAAPRRDLAPAVLLLAVAAAYATSFAGGFQFDDWNVIVDEPRVRSLEAWWRSMPGMRPLLKLSYALNHESGLGLAGFHAANVALHAANALLALGILRRLEPGGHPRAALAGALVFALHPVQTEAVTYLSGRSTALAATFALASVLAWQAGRARGRGALTHVASPLLLAASLAAKELAAVLPAALVVLHLSDRARPPSWRGALRDTAGHWAVVALAAAAFAAGPYPRMLRESLALRGPVENVLTQVRAVGWLAGQLVLVHRLDADPALPAVRVAGAGVVLLAAALLALALWAVAALRRRPAAPATLWFLLWLAPAGWWLPRAEPANDRQLYVALLAPAWLVGRWLAAWASSGRARAAAAAALLAALAGATAARSLVYRDEVGFWEDVARKSPHGARAFNNLGWALAQEGRAAEAEAAFRRAVALDPTDYRARANLARLRGGDLTVPPGAAP